MHPPQQKRHILHRTLLCAILLPGILYCSPDAEPGFPPILAAVASESNPAEATSGPFYPLADTGQSLCYDESSSISCGGTSFPNQDGDVTSPVPRGLRPPQLNDGYPADYITVDQSTGLVWKTCLPGLSGVSCSNGSAQTSDWSAAMAICQALNSANSGAGYAGRTDWRLSTTAELETIHSYGLASPALYAGHFPGNPSIQNWTATEYSGSATVAFAMSVADGNTTTEAKTNTFVARCVSGERRAPTFTDNGNGTVTETTTGLIFQKCSSGQTNDASCTGTVTNLTWKDALLYCYGLTLAGRSDWRLPALNELKLLLDRSVNNPASNAAQFPNTSNGFYWTSTTAHFNATSAWRLDFSVGNVLVTTKTVTYPARCVRGP
ncbi:MAG: hypothetical protein CMN76_09285 [Spirochaetaceae bacterium]|nr:hypothetical protein [Spirochaetaceae bacterium]|tara:strand:+ start:15413 stop:16549 length:1137 start_codon:yes stop_codon:yes gene_type:complete